MKHDITKAIQFSNTFRYIDDLFSINNVDFGNYISAIYPPELQLTDTSTSSSEVCYLDTHIKTGDTTTPFRISIYDKRDDFTFRIVNFPHMDSNIPANPAYGVYISHQLRYINTVSWIGGNVAVHMRKVDNPECKVISRIVDADTERFCNNN